MSYLVLARKYRPKRISEVAGQEVAMAVLTGALKEDRVGHAYLFCGPRGTGKTTTARILAKALNCERREGPDPCGECPRCLSIDSGSDVDVIEIDAASNRSIEDVRELRERVAYAPMNGRYKVYIVDEVHMLTPPANNALLKTLEEPPAHVKFFFATTEPQKLLDTVRSRCQIVQLALIREEEIARHLERILDLEGVTAEPGVVAELARRARGSMRDALSLTDQLLALVGTNPGLEDVQRIAGSSGAEFVDRLLGKVERGERPAVLELLAGSQGGELELVDALLEHVRGALVASLCPRESALFESEPAERERRSARAERLGLERLQVWLEELLAARERMGALESHARIVLEVTLLDLCRAELSLPLEELARRLLELEARLGVVAAPTSAPATAPSPAPSPAPSAAPAAGTGGHTLRPVARQAAPSGATPARPRAPAPAPPPAPKPATRRAPEPARETTPDPAAGAPARSGVDDFTNSVADLFTGQVEEP